MFSFEWPWMAILALLPLLVSAFWPSKRSIKPAHAPEFHFPYTRRLKNLVARPLERANSNRANLVLLGLIWLSLTLALMRPELVNQFQQVRNSGYDLMLAVDLSGSMRALDYSRDDEQVSRLDVVKSVVGDFVSRRQGDRIGLILFGTNAYLHVPLTLDTASVRNMLNNTVVGEAGDSTAIGDAIGLAVANLRNRPEKSRVIILLTDGGDNSSTIPPLEAAKLARQYGIRIYTIGVGSQGPVPIPDENGQIVTAEFDLDEDLLRNIASITNGSYFRASDTQALQSIYSQIDKLEKTQAEAHKYVIQKPLYRYPLAFALSFLLLLSIFPFFRTRAYGI